MKQPANLEFKNFDPETTTDRDCSFRLKTDTCVISVSWEGGDAAEVLINADDGGTFIDYDCHHKVAVKCNGEWVYISDLLNWAADNLDAFIEEEREEHDSDCSMREELSSPYMTGRI